MTIRQSLIIIDDYQQLLKIIDNCHTHYQFLMLNDIWLKKEISWPSVCWTVLCNIRKGHYLSLWWSTAHSPNPQRHSRQQEGQKQKGKKIRCWNLNHFCMVLTLLKFQNANWFIRNTDFPENSFWKISNVCRPKTPPTTPRSLFWHINCDVPKWKIINMLLDGFQSHDI